MTTLLNRLLTLLVLVAATASWATAQEASMVVPPTVLNGIGFDVTVEVTGDTLSMDAYTVQASGGSAVLVYDEDDGVWMASGVTVTSTGAQDIVLLRSGQEVVRQATRSIPGWLSILPPLLAIGIALIFKRVVPALFLGIWVGAITALSFTFKGVFMGLLNTFEHYILQEFITEEHGAIILFTLMIGGMVGIISKNGGMQGVVNLIVRWASNAKKGQLATSFLGIAIFFDDYANSLVVGNTMRPVTDRLRISREKLAYLVDSTAAPVACIALVTTWIGYEVGMIGDAIDKIDGLEGSAYGFFLSSIPYSFYPVLAVFFVFLVSWTGRDFGPMYTAEKRARTLGQVTNPNSSANEAENLLKEMTPVEGKPQRAINAILPVLVLVFGVLVGLYATGTGETLNEIIGSSNSFKALMWASMLGVLTAAFLSITQRIMDIEQVVESWFSGLKGMMFAMIILIMAWALSAVTTDLHTASFLVSILGDSLNAGFVPTIVFILAAATAFATGSSWGAMGILMPLVIPLTWAVMAANGQVEAHDYHILYSSISAILAGSVWGDHCSPISDTTILSSMASSCNHIDHVRTQLPYAALVGGVAVLFGTLPAGFGFPWWISMGAGMIILTLFLRFYGKIADNEPVVA
ncbi:MAG: Na+/H+ antiporter NhaC family protein [Bacteroidetes bacterium]|nr:Na+/H+ antiporter NhaC family protein [Bacteroidota bacterium]